MILNETLEDNLPVVRVQTDLGTLIVSLYGGHVISWVPAGKEEVFYMSPLSGHEGGKPLRGGIPVCWPWFGKIEMPQHGLARTALWTLESVEEFDGGNAKLLLSFEPEGWNGLRVEMEILFGDELVQRLTTRAGSTEVVYSEALHSYFNVGDVRQVTVSGLSDIPFEERAKKGSAASESPLRLRNWMDRIYYPAVGELRLRDESMDRTIVIAREGSRSVVVWNPWDEGAREIADLPDDGWTDFICVETANIGPASHSLSPGEFHTMSHTIWIE